MTDKTNEVAEVLNEIKASVDTKFETTVQKSELAEVLKSKANTSEIAVLKSNIETIEAKLDAIPSPSIISQKDISMTTINKLFEKNLAAGGKAEAEIVLKNITATTNVIGAPVETYGLTGSLFAANPFRALSANIETNSKGLVLPVRSGSHGAAASNASVRALTAGGTSAVAEISVMLKTIEALTEVTVETADDIIGFDQFWTQDMLDEVASIEAQSHVTLVAGLAGVTANLGTQLSLDDLAALHFSVAPQYRANGAFVLSSGAMAQIRALNTSSTGGDLVFDAQLGIFRLFGQPVYENAYMASPALSAVVGAFGDFSKGLVIANRGVAEVGRYEQTKPGYYTYRAAIRSGIAQWDANAVKTLKMKAS
jgi:HK97 family phage major capsid protein